MPIDARHLGRRYGPYRFEVGLERIRDFVAAVGGGVPGRVFSAPPTDPHPFTWEEAAARASRHRGLVAPPAFATAFAIQPFAVACSDPELGIDLVRLLHAEQEFEHGVPVRPGDELTTVGEIVEIRSRGSLEFLAVRTETVNGAGERVLVGRWTAVVRGP